MFVAFAVLGGAFFLARPFRHDSRRQVRPVSQAGEHVVLRETPAPGDVDLLRPEAPTAEIQPTLLAPPTGVAEPQHEPDNEASRLAPPPIMARTYPGSNSFAQDIPVSQRTMRRTHEVRDGDTLESLAQQYLGDRSRWREIFQANLDQIQQPELLPLAARLVIPPRALPPHSGSPDEPRDKPVSQAPLVPLVP